MGKIPVHDMNKLTLHSITIQTKLKLDVLSKVKEYHKNCQTTKISSNVSQQKTLNLIL